MYKRLSAIMFPLVLIALIGSVIWGYRENQEKNAVLIKAENQYQRAFHDLSYHVDQLHSQLGNALVANSTSQDFHKRCLINVWRVTSEAQNEINQLPLTLMPFNKTEEFLANISRFSYKTALRDMDKEPMTKEEMAMLKELYKRSGEISKELRSVQAKVIDEKLRWMDVELALATQREQLDNTVVDGFKTIDKRVAEYEELNWGPSVGGTFQTNQAGTLNEPEVSEKQVARKALKLLGLKETQEYKVVENGKGTEYSSFSFSAVSADDQTIMADFTKKGGKLLWFMNNRPVETKKLSIDQAADKAASFLKQQGYPEMQAVGYDEYQNVASLTMAAVRSDVLIYPERLTIKVALDNGEVTGLQATDFVYEQKQRKLSKPELTEQEARKKLNPNFKVRQARLALIENELREEVLVYEFIGSINEADYRVYLNALTGLEEMIEEIRQVDLEAGIS